MSQGVPQWMGSNSISMCMTCGTITSYSISMFTIWSQCLRFEKSIILQLLIVELESAPHCMIQESISVKPITSQTTFTPLLTDDKPRAFVPNEISTTSLQKTSISPKVILPEAISVVQTSGDDGYAMEYPWKANSVPTAWYVSTQVRTAPSDMSSSF